MNIILTGVPGIGKTTLTEKIVEALGGRAGGIVTREVREGGRRTGFTIESLDGDRRMLASKSGKRGPKVGPYTVDIENLETVGLGALRRSLDRKQVIVIDEIGKMELISAGFRAMILEVLDSRLATVATMGVARNPFMDAVRERPDVEVIRVTLENRDELEDRVLRLVKEALTGGRLEG